MRVLITGVAGFIGSNLAKRCINEGWQVDGVDNLSNGHEEFLFNIKLNQFMKCSFSDESVLSKIEKNTYDFVFHLAAMPRVSYSVEYPVESHDVNVTQTIKLITACRNNVNKFIFASSSSVYGGAEILPTPETCAKNPVSPYALQKSIIEDYLKLYAKLYNLNSACLRFFNVFGPNSIGGTPYSTAIASWLTCLHQGKHLRSDGDGTQTRDMCYVDNVTEACVMASSKDAFYGGEVFNIATNNFISNNAILDYLKKRYPNIVVYNVPPRSGDVKHTCANIEKANRWFGYKPLYNHWEGIDKSIIWFENNKDLVIKIANKIKL